ncbi:MAG: STAS domain-containing protein [Pseudomonadota bacterium]|nr:STAS domain-containing protein [Pseudomonadota bacterium]
MELSTRTEGAYTVVELQGEVDLHFSPRLRNRLLSELSEGHPLLIDLDEVTYMDSSGIASMVEAYQLAKNNDLDFGLVGVKGPVLQVLQLARLDKVFPIDDTVGSRIARDAG